MRALLKKSLWAGIVIVFLLGVLIFLMKVPRYYVESDNTNVSWGVTFSKKYAQELGLDWKETYLATLNELRVDHIRIPVYWDDIELTQSSIDLTDYKFMLDEAQANNVEVILAIGERLPRWPECHTPEWTEELTAEEKEAALFTMLEIVVKSFVEYEAITAWQVENEPLVEWFGICGRSNPELVAREIAFVKTFDDRPIIVTDSGEWGLWGSATALGGDRFGITTYRVVWNEWLGFIRFAFPPSFYRYKATLFDVPWDSVFSAELQGEPWIPGTKGLIETPITTQYLSMSPEQFSANIQYGRALGVPEVYVWGVEWWYWLKTHGSEIIWDEAKTLWES